MRRWTAVAPVLLIGGCTGWQTPLRPAGEQAQHLYSLFGLMLWVCGSFYLLVLVFLGWGVLRARRRRGEGPEIEPADRGLDRALIVWAALIVVGLTVLAVGTFLVDRALAQAEARETLLVRVTAQQWWWRVQYRDPASGTWIETANELHLPIGRTTRIELGSTDVIHSLWIPNLAGKTDVIPGRANALDVTPRRLGWFRGQCAEFCGAQHAHMALWAKVESPAAFAQWLARQAEPAASPATPEQARGLAVVTQGPCAACHSIRGTPAAGKPGPDLTHVASRRSLAAGMLPMTRGALQGWIARPEAIKPGTLMPAVSLSPADTDAAAAYLTGLR
ncbi:MAG TPA: cytochrome c oxidase subunit II [Sphingomonas sp.]|nr:cytochrome c oxidase subunit II [Sphingomonas sp.]